MIRDWDNLAKLVDRQGTRTLGQDEKISGLELSLLAFKIVASAELILILAWLLLEVL